MSRRKLPLLALLSIVAVGTTMAQVPSLSFDKYTVPFVGRAVTLTVSTPSSGGSSGGGIPIGAGPVFAPTVMIVDGAKGGVVSIRILPKLVEIPLTDNG